MKCSKCGAGISVGQKYCARCGAPVSGLPRNTTVLVITGVEARNGCRRELYTPGMAAPMLISLRPGITDKSVLEVNNARYYDENGQVVVRPLRVTVRVRGRRGAGRTRLKWWMPVAAVFVIICLIGIIGENNKQTGDKSSAGAQPRSEGVFAEKVKSVYGEKTQEELLEDVIAVDPYMNEYSLTPVSAELIKRQTNPEDKTDYVWLHVVAENGDFRYDTNYELSYVLYNDGWDLEDYDDYDAEYEALSVPDRQLVEDEINSRYSDGAYTGVSFVSGEYGKVYSYNTGENEENRNAYIMTYSASQKMSSCLSLDLEIQVFMEFTPYESWRVYNIEENTVGEHWDILGLWSYEDEDVSLKVNVLDFNAETCTATVEYSLYTSIDLEESRADPYYLTYTRLEPGEEYKSAATESIELTEYTYGTEPNYEIYYYFCDPNDVSREIAELWVCGLPTSWVMAGDGDGIAVHLIGRGSNADLIYWLSRG